MAVKIFLIRHAETQWNLCGRYCGFSDIELNIRGIQQAEDLADKFKREKISGVYASDLKRAVQTAAIVFGGNMEKTPSLREMNFGIFEGLNYEEIMSKYGEKYSKWQSNIVDMVLPCGESLRFMAERVRKKFKDIIEKIPRDYKEYGNNDKCDG